MLPCSFYVIDSITKTPNVPYGETFQTVMRFCLMFDTPTSMYLRVTMMVDFFRSVLWESKIEKGALDGCTNLVKDVVAQWRKTFQNSMLHHGEIFHSFRKIPTMYKFYRA